MTTDRFLDRLLLFLAEEQQVCSLQQLFQATSGGLPAEQILDEQAPWDGTFSSKPPAVPETELQAGGLDPRG